MELNNYNGHVVMETSALTCMQLLHLLQCQFITLYASLRTLVTTGSMS